jgi:glycosyltransferase involved in cell wall biosynthesis
MLATAERPEPAADRDPMKVLFVTHSFPRHSGDPAGAFILRLARALVADGVTVQVIAPSATGLVPHDTIDGISVSRYRYAPQEWETLAYTGNMAEQVSDSLGGKVALVGMLGGGTIALRQAIAAFKPDVVHAHWWFPSGLLALGAFVSQPLVTTLHGSDVRLARTKVGAPMLFRRVIEKSSAVTAVSPWLASEAVAMAPGLDCTIAPMPVDTELFAPEGTRSTNRFLFVGRLNSQKGIALLLEAVACTTRGAELDVIGDGTDRATLESQASRLGIAGRVTFHGAQSQEALVRFCRSAAVVVIPSENEGLGLVAVEAQLCEAPVIAFRSGGLPDVVRDGVTGVLTPPGDVQSLAAAMDALSADPARGAQLGRAGRAAALSRFAPAAASEAYRAIYDRVTRG